MTSSLLDKIYAQYMEIAIQQKLRANKTSDMKESDTTPENKEKHTPSSPTKSEKSIVWFVLGPIGAGKSTYIHSVMREYPQLKFLSADILKRDHNLSYLDTRNIMERIIKGHVDSGVSFITEGTGQHDDLYDLFVEYKQNEAIELRVTYIDVDIDVALERNRRRERVLTDDTVREVHERCKQRKHKWLEFGCRYISYKDLLTQHVASGIY